MKPKLEVGQKLWLVTRWHGGRELEVIRVGRKYGFVNFRNRDIRFTLDDWLIDRHEQLYESKKAYEFEVAANKAFREAGNRLLYLAHNLPDETTVEQINAAIETLTNPTHG